MSFREISKIIKAYEKKVRLGTKKGGKKTISESEYLYKQKIE